MVTVKKSEDVSVEEVSAGVATNRQVLIGSSDGARNFFLRKFSIGAGGSMPFHTNTVEHEQYVLSGRAVVKVGEEEYNVAAGDVVFIPANVPHSYRTVGDESFVFLCAVPNLEDKVTLVGAE